MKKVLSIVLTVALMLTLVACFAGCGKKGGISGKWKLDYMEQGEMKLSISDLEKMSGEKVEFYLELKADGTGVMNSMGEKTDMAYGDGQIWPAEDPSDKVPYKLSGNTLTLEQDGMKLVFKK